MSGEIIGNFWGISIRLASQDGDSDDDAEGFAFNSDDTQPSGDNLPAPSQGLEGVSTYGEDDLVPEPHRVSKTNLCIFQQSLWAQFILHILLITSRLDYNLSLYFDL